MAETQSAKPSFNIPKIKRQLSKDNLRTVDLKSRDAQEVCNVVERSYLDNQKTLWEVKTIHMVDNKELESQYRAKRQCMKEEGRHSRELQEHYTFLLVSQSNIQKLAQEGLKTNNLPSFDSLGDCKLAVQVCKHADIQLHLAESRALQTCSLMLFKVTYGKCKPMTVQTSSAHVEPTPNYDCHTSHERAVPNDILNTQMLKSMVYLYEYNDDCETIDRPRHVLPHAVITYRKSSGTSATSKNKPGYSTSGYTARSHQAGKSQSKEEKRSSFQQKMAEKIQKRLQMEAELLQRQTPMFPPRPIIQPLPPLYGMHHPVMFTHVAQSTNIPRNPLDPRVQREQMSARKLEVPLPNSPLDIPPLPVHSVEDEVNSGYDPFTENIVFEDPYSPTPEDQDDHLQSEIDDAIVRMIDLKAKVRYVPKKDDIAHDVKNDGDSPGANKDVIPTETEVKGNNEGQESNSMIMEMENIEMKQIEDEGFKESDKIPTAGNVENTDDGSHVSLDLEKRIEMLSSVISSDGIGYKEGEETKSGEESVPVRSLPATVESSTVTIESPPKMVPPPHAVSKCSPDSVARKLFTENEPDDPDTITVDSVTIKVSDIPLPPCPSKSSPISTSTKSTSGPPTSTLRDTSTSVPPPSTLRDTSISGPPAALMDTSTNGPPLTLMDTSTCGHPPLSLTDTSTLGHPPLTLMGTSTHGHPPINSMTYQYVSQQPMNYPQMGPSHTFTHYAEDIDERWHQPNHTRVPVVNDMGDVDLRSVPLRDPRIVYGTQYSNQPYPHSHVFHSNLEPHHNFQNQEQRIPATVSVGVENQASFPQNLQKPKENIDSDGSNTDSPSKGKLSLAAYKARKKSGAPHLRLKMNRAKSCASDSDSVSASDEEGKSFKSPVGHISPRLSPRRPNINVPPEKLKPSLYNYSYYHMEQAGYSSQANHPYYQSEAGGRGISTQANMPSTQGPQLATFQPTVQYENIRNENQGGNTPDSAKSMNLNILGGSFLDSVNLDISNLKNILQNINVSPTTSPIKDPKSDTEELVTSFDDAPWSNVEPVKRQLSEEEAHAAERYDAYNISTNTAVDSSLDKSDDCDYDALVAKIKNLRQEIDQMKKTENEGKSPRSAGMDVSNIAWPSPLKQIAELQKVDSKDKEKAKEDEVGADLLEDLSYFQKSPEAPSVPIPGFGFGESPMKLAEDTEECSDKDSSENKMVVDITEDSDDDVSNEKNNVSSVMEDSTVTNNQSPEKKDEYITIDDEEDLDESNVGLAIVTDDEDEKESDGELIILQPLSPSPKPSLVPSPVPSQAASPTTAMGPASPDPEIETETLDGDTVILRLDTNSDVISIDDVDDMAKEKKSIATVPFKGFYKDILSSDSEKLQNKEDLPSHQASKSILENLHYVSSLTDDSIAESGTTTEHSTPEKNDDTVNDAVTKNEEFWRNLEKLQKAKRQKLKKNREMQGYRSRKRTKRGKKMKDATSDQNDLESVGSEFSSEFSGMDKSSIVDGSNLSGRGSPSVEVLEDKVRVSGPMLLEDFGLSHWREAENDQRFQPVVHLEMLPDDMARTIIVKDVREENLIPFDTEDALPKQERVQAWIERFANKKKIKLTLKNKRKNIPDEAGSRIPVIGQKSVSLGQEKSITNRSSSETATKIPTVLSSSSTTTTISITTVSAVSQQTSTIISHLPTTNTTVVTQPSHPTTAVMYYQAKPGPPLYYQSQTPAPAPSSHITSQPGYVQHQAVHTLPVRPFVARHQVPPVQHIPRVHVLPAVPVQPVIPVPRVPLIVPPTSMPVPPPGQVRPLVPAMSTVATTPPAIVRQQVPVVPHVMATGVSHNPPPSAYSQPPVIPTYQPVQPSTQLAAASQGQVLPTAPASSLPTPQYPNTSLYHNTSQASTMYKENQSQQITKVKDKAKKRSTSDVMDWFTDKLAPKKKLYLDVSRSDIADSDSLSRSSGSTGSRTPETPRRTDELWDIAYGKVPPSTKPSKAESFLETSTRVLSSSSTKSVEDEAKSKQLAETIKQGSLEDRIDSYRSKIFSDGPEKIVNDPLAENIKSISKSETNKSSIPCKVIEIREEEKETKIEDIKKTAKEGTSLLLKKYSETKQANDKQKSYAQRTGKEFKESVGTSFDTKMTSQERTSSDTKITSEVRIISVKKVTSEARTTSDKNFTSEMCTSSDKKISSSNTKIASQKGSSEGEETSNKPNKKPESGTGVMFKNTLTEVKQVEVDKEKYKSPGSVESSNTLTEKKDAGGVKQDVVTEKVAAVVCKKVEKVAKEGTKSDLKTAEKAYETIESLSKEKEMLEKKLAELAKLSPARQSTTGKKESLQDAIIVSDEELEEGEIIDDSEEEEADKKGKDSASGKKDSPDKRVVISLDSEDENDSFSKRRLSVTIGSGGKKGDEFHTMDVDKKSDRRKVIKETRDLRDELNSGREDERIIYDSRSGRDDRRSRRDQYKRRDRSKSKDRSSSKERRRSRSSDRWRSRSQERHRGTSSHSSDRSHSRQKSRSPDSSNSRERKRSTEKYGAKKSVSDDWSKLLQQEEKRIEKLRYKKINPSLDDISSITQNATNNKMATSFDEELKAYSSSDQRKTISYEDQDILAPQIQPKSNTSNVNKLSQTIRAWVKEEFGDIEMGALQRNLRCNFDTDIFTLSKNQRKTLRNRIRKEVEKLHLVTKSMITSLFEKAAEGQCEPNTDQRVVVTEPASSDHPEIASVTVQISVQVIPFQPLEFPKSKIQEELKLIRSHLKLLWVKTRSHSESQEYLFSLRQDLQQIETDLVQRFANFDNTYGVPNRRVPDSVLLRSEICSHMSEEGLVLLLSGAIPAKPYSRLIKIKEELQNVMKNMESARLNNQKTEYKALNAQLVNLHTDRKAIMLTFTGPLTKKRQNKLKMKLKVYCCCMDYFDNELGAVAIRNLGFMRTTLRDLERHYAIITHLLTEQEERNHRETLKQMSQGIEDRKQRAVVEKLKNDLTLVDNKLSMMYRQYENNTEICAAINDVLRQIKVALQLIACHHQAERMPPESVTKLRDILQYSLHGYTTVKQQIDMLKAYQEGPVLCS